MIVIFSTRWGYLLTCLPVILVGSKGQLNFFLKDYHTPTPMFARYGEYQREYSLQNFISPDVWKEAYHLPPDSYVHILGLHEFHDMKLNFKCGYIDTN